MNNVFIFNFIVNFTYYGLFIVNFQHMSYLARREKCRNMCFNKLQIQVFFLSNMRPLYIIIFKYMETRENYMRGSWLQLLSSYIIVILYILLTVNLSRLTKIYISFTEMYRKTYSIPQKKKLAKIMVKW